MDDPANADDTEDDLLVAARNLLSLRSSSSIDDLFARLMTAERILTRVEQDSPMPIKKALVPVMTALTKDKLLKHPDENVQVIVASCLNQATRITAPVQPYWDHQMRDIFRLFMVVLRQFFFDTIRPNHSVAIFKYMVAVMTLVIDSARMDNKMSRGSSVDYGDEMVNVRITVWWPMDKTFYTTGAVFEEFIRLTKKHKVVYDDDEEEILDLSEERWEFFKERQPQQVQSSHNQEEAATPCAEEPAKNEKKKTKRKASSSRKRLAPSSPKSEGRSPVQVANEPDEEGEEMPELSFKHGKSRAGKKKSKTMKKKRGP
ncbi:hypothetical protein ACP275_04G112300 [Erythranthe tilingii]